MYPKKTEFPTVEAFESQGVKYYQFAADGNIPVERALAAMDVYESLDSKCDYLYLTALSECIDEALNRGKLSEVFKINAHFKSRLERPNHSDRVYWLASVLFFDENENPLRYDEEYAKIKIQKWKKDPELLTFFLSLRTEEYLPYLEAYGADFQNFMTAIKKLERREISNLMNFITEMDGRRAQYLKSQLSTPQEPNPSEN